jgi:hypothetical protein
MKNINNEDVKNNTEINDVIKIYKFINGTYYEENFTLYDANLKSKSAEIDNLIMSIVYKKVVSDVEIYNKTCEIVKELFYSEDAVINYFNTVFIGLYIVQKFYDTPSYKNKHVKACSQASLNRSIMMVDMINSSDKAKAVVATSCYEFNEGTFTVKPNNRDNNYAKPSYDKIMYIPADANKHEWFSHPFKFFRDMMDRLDLDGKLHKNVIKFEYIPDKWVSPHGFKPKEYHND